MCRDSHVATVLLLGVTVWSVVICHSEERLKNATWESHSRCVILSETTCSEESGCGRHAHSSCHFERTREICARSFPLSCGLPRLPRSGCALPRSDRVGRCTLSSRTECSEAWQSLCRRCTLSIGLVYPNQILRYAQNDIL